MEAANQLPTETNSISEENFPTPRVEKSLKANIATPSTLSRFHREDFLFKRRYELGAYDGEICKAKLLMQHS